MFASKSLAAHLARGGIGLGAAALAVRLVGTSVPAAAALLAVALVALRGCPMCWTLGLVQRLLPRARGEPAEGACRDGACARRP